jgi:hypothetical protein
MKGQVTGLSAADESKWQAEDDLRTLARAIEINKDPKRKAAAVKMAKEKSAELASIAKQ